MPHAASYAVCSCMALVARWLLRIIFYSTKTYNAHAQTNKCKSGYEYIYQTEQFARKLC